jgi:hypothetical protein
MTTTKNTIRIEQVCKQYAKIRNAGGIATANFLAKNSRHFLTMSDGPLQNAHALQSERLANFEAYARSNGFDVVHGREGRA